MTATTVDITISFGIKCSTTVNTWPGQWSKDAPQVCSISPSSEVAKFPSHRPSQAVRPPAWQMLPCATTTTCPPYEHTLASGPSAMPHQQGDREDNLKAPQNREKEWCSEEGKFQSYSHSLRLLIQLKRKLKDTGLQQIPPYSTTAVYPEWGQDRRRGTTLTLSGN